MSDGHPTLSGPLRNCPPVWFQDDYYSPDGHWIECVHNRVHLGSVVEWIGNTPISHGERDGSDEQPNGPYEHPCLCGHPDFMTCPSEIAGVGGIYNLTIRKAE